jgi:phage tail sheath protein FI
MGGRTRKLYGPDRYINARRTLIYIEDSLKLSTQYAVFENNDQRLWTSLRATARMILNPIWERGGLAGMTAAQAYYVVCDATINTPQVVQSGEVRMEVGVALQYPAEFVVIRVTQFDSGANLTAELLPGQIAA